VNYSGFRAEIGNPGPTNSKASVLRMIREKPVPTSGLLKVKTPGFWGTSVTGYPASTRHIPATGFPQINLA